MTAAAIGQRVIWTYAGKRYAGQVLQADMSCCNALVRFEPTDALPELDLWVVIRNLDAEA